MGTALGKRYDVIHSETLHCASAVDATVVISGLHLNPLRMGEVIDRSIKLVCATTLFINCASIWIVFGPICGILFSFLSYFWIVLVSISSKFIISFSIVVMPIGCSLFVCIIVFLIISCTRLFGAFRMGIVPLTSSLSITSTTPGVFTVFAVLIGRKVFELLRSMATCAGLHTHLLGDAWINRALISLGEVRLMTSGDQPLPDVQCYHRTSYCTMMVL